MAIASQPGETAPSPPGDPEDTPSFKLHFRPSVELISIVRRFVSEFYEQVVADADAAGRLALATHELLENAAKYTTGGETSLEVELDRAAGTVAVSTRNRTDPARIAVLTRSFGESAAITDPDAYYTMVLRRSVLENKGSGLGLARIRVEGEMSLTLRVEHDVVEIQARALIAGGASL